MDQKEEARKVIIGQVEDSQAIGASWMGATRRKQSAGLESARTGELVAPIRGMYL